MANVTGKVYRKDSYSIAITSGVVSAYSIDVTPNLQSWDYANGTGAKAADLLYGKKLTLAAAAQTLDLTSLTDPAGGTANFARVREVIVENLSSTPGQNVVVGNAASNAWSGFLSATGTVTIPPGGRLTISDPNSVTTAGGITGGSSKMLKLDPGASTFDVAIALVGGSTQGA